MARYTGPVCRLCRRERMKLFLKGDRCFKEKCAIERRGYPPGQHGQRRGAARAGLWPAAAREAEGQAHLRRARAAVPGLLQGGRPAQGHHRREPAGDARAAARQRRLQPRLRLVAGAGAAARAPRSHPGGRQEGDHPVVSRCARGRRSRSRRPAGRTTSSGASVETARGRGVPEWLELDAESFTGKVVAPADPRGHQAADPGTAHRRALQPLIEASELGGFICFGRVFSAPSASRSITRP